MTPGRRTTSSTARVIVRRLGDARLARRPGPGRSMGWPRQPRLRSPPLPGFRPDDHDHHQCRRGRTDRTDTVRRRQPRSGVTRAIIIMIMMSAGAWRTISGLPVPTCQAGDFRPRFHCPARVSESESLRPLASTGPAAEPARLFGPVGPCAKTKS